jgi:asparagine synthase (glutamine-hydrolysing)
LNSEFEANIRNAAESYRAQARGRKISFVAFKQVPWHHYSRLALERTQLTVRSPYLDNDLVSLVFRAPPESASSQEVALRLIADADRRLSRIATDRGIVHPPIPLVTAARRLFQNFTFKAEYAFDYGMPQWLATVDHALAPLHLEKLFLGRHKFYHFRTWYRNHLSDYVKQILLDPRTKARPYLRGEFLEKMVVSHVNGTGNYTREIHKILTTELIERQLIETN